ncbi:MAG: antibiotic biosynthesis monooxygenase family protein [Acidimicrobiales bacterium]
MVLELAVLEVIPGQEAAFEEAFSTAKAIISAAPGFQSLRLSRCLENPSRYLLLVEWDRLENHTDGFRGSAAYQEWRTLLHHFYSPFPTVDHYEEIAVIR